MQGKSFLDWRRTTALAVVFLLWLGTSLLADHLGFSPRHVLLTWTGPPATTQTIVWHTGEYAAPGWVEYWAADAQQTASRKPAAKTLVETDAGVMAVHTVQLDGLAGGTSYQYRVGNGVLKSERSAFVTATETPEAFKFLLFSDSQGARFETWRRTLTAAQAQHRDARFLVHGGDLVDVGLSYRQWRDWFRAGKGIVDALPVLPTLGNHETYSTEATIVPPLLYQAFFPLPANGPAALRGRVYSFDYGEAHLVFLDSQAMDEIGGEDGLQLQQAWLDADLAAAGRRWKLIFIHRPFYHDRANTAGGRLAQAFAPVLEKHAVDAVFSGHEHIYARTNPVADGQWTDEQGHGTVYFTAGRSGEKSYGRFQKKVWDAAFHNPQMEPNYLTVAVSERELRVQAFSLSGELLDDWRKVVAAN